jgi:carboxyl-terminal processing protease
MCIRGRLYLLSLALVPFISTTGRLEETGPNLVEEIAALQTAPLAEIWPAIEKLRRRFQDDRQETKRLADEISTLGDEAGDQARLAGAALLYNHRDDVVQRSGQAVIQQIARTSKEPSLRMAAIGLLHQSPVRRDLAIMTLRDILIQPDTTPEITIAASLAYWKLDNYPQVRTPILRLLQDEDSRPAVAYAAALALAETGYSDPDVKELLLTLRDEPSQRGKLAELLLQGLKPGAPVSGPPPAAPPRIRAPQEGAESGNDEHGADSRFRAFVSVLVEVLEAIYNHHRERERLELRQLTIAAVKGMVSGLDTYSSFQDPNEVEQIEARARTLGSHWGLGATLVRPKGAPYAVEKVNPRGPAARAGIRPSDRILEVDGVTTDNRSRAELERLKPRNVGDEVRLRILRWGWSKPKTVTVKTGKADVASTKSRLLAGNVGYVKIFGFRPGSAAEFSGALDRLESMGLQALILDLRNNRGGRLDEAVAIVDEFVDGPEAVDGRKAIEIVTERAPDGSLLGATYANPGARSNYPVVVLVNGRTASAAEVVAGALQDLVHAAVIIGKLTFGKGVTQVELPLSRNTVPFLGGESRLFLTTKELHRPDGRSLQEGVEPDVTVADPTRPAFDEGPGTPEAEEILRIQYSLEVDAYMHKNYDTVKKFFEDGKIWDPSEQPDFQELYDALNTPLERSLVSHALRHVVSHHFGEEAEETTRDDLEDKQLVRGILELLPRINRDPKNIPEYQGISR